MNPASSDGWEALRVTESVQNVQPPGIKNLSFFFFFRFLGPYPWHMEVPSLGVELGLEPCLPPTPQLMATPDC